MGAKLFCAIMYSSEETYNKALKILLKKLGEIEAMSEEYAFNFTDYYLKEFGPNLKKRFIVFKRMIERSELPKIKLLACKIEQKLSRLNSRTVNIDPGYITLNNVMVASTKELPHRVYLDKGIFADVQLILKKSEALTFRHTFADYDKNKDFFLEERKRLV